MGTVRLLITMGGMAWMASAGKWNTGDKVGVIRFCDELDMQGECFYANTTYSSSVLIPDSNAKGDGGSSFTVSPGTWAGRAK